MAADTQKLIDKEVFMLISHILIYIMSQFIMDNVQLIATVKMFGTAAAHKPTW